MKTPLRSLALATILAAALTQQASAETVTLQLSNATVDVPEGWTHKDAGNNTMALDEPNKQVNISIISTEGKNLLTVVTNVTAMLKKMMPKLKLDKGKKAAINGNVGKVFVGAGVLGPKPVKVALHVLETPDHHGLMIISLVEAAKFKAHSKTVAAIIASLKPPAAAPAPEPPAGAPPAGDTK